MVRKNDVERSGRGADVPGRGRHKTPLWHLRSGLQATIVFYTIMVLVVACSGPVGRRRTPTARSGATPTITTAIGTGISTKTPAGSSGKPATPTLPPQPTPTQRPLPPDLIESDPPQGVEVGLQAPITLYFNQAMDHQTVEFSLREQFGSQAQYTWIDDATVIVTPAAPLQPATELQVQLSDQVRAANGMPVSKPIYISYRTVGYLQLSQALPERDAAEVSADSAVVASFNYPIVPLGGDPESLPAAFSLEPAAAGRGEWVNTSTYIFYPEPALEGGRRYTVSLNPELRGAQGSPLTDVESWSFSTASPRLVSIETTDQSPSEVQGARLDTSFRLTFNQPMDPVNTVANFSVTDPSGASVPGEVTWEDNDKILTFKPSDLLQRDTDYTVHINGEAQARGGTPLGEGSSTIYHTVPDFAVANTSPFQGRQMDVYGAVEVYFSAPINTKDYQRHFSISPRVPNLQVWWDEYMGVTRLYGSFQPNGKYSMIVSPDLLDAWGQPLGKEYSLDFSIAPAQPSLAIYGGCCSLFVTGTDSSLQAEVVNINVLPISIAEVPPDAIYKISSMMYEDRQNYRPDNIRSWKQKLDVSSNRVETVDIYLSPDRQPLAPGLYWMRIDLGDVFSDPLLIVVSNVNLAFKLSASDAFVWATDLRTNRPLANMPVSIYSPNGELLLSGFTDTDGVFHKPVTLPGDLWAGYSAILGQPGEDIFGLVSSNWYRGVSGSEFGMGSDYRPPHPLVYLYSDRPIYRPGQTVYFRAIARQANNGRYTLLDRASLPLKLTDSMGKELATFDLPLSIFGTAHGEFTLPESASPGYYSLSVPELDYNVLSFQVAEYRKPEINLQVSFAEDKVLAGQSLNAAVDARYFFDAPAGDLPVHWALYARPETLYLPGYQVGSADTNWLRPFYYPFFGFGLGALISEGDARTGPDGKLALALPTETDLMDMRQRQIFTLEASLTEESGLPVSGRATVMVNPSEYFIGVRPQSWAGRAGEPSNFDLLAVDWDEKPAGRDALGRPRSLQANFSKVVWVFDETVDPYMGSQYTPEYTPIDSKEIATGADGQASVSFTPPEPGTYQLSVSGTDPQGGQALTEVIVWIVGEGEVVWPELSNQRIRLVADKDQYKPGETAQIFIPNPFAGETQALVTVERGIVMRHQIYSLAPGGETIDVPLTSEDAPNVYVSVTLLAADGLPAQAGEGARPDFRQGYLNLLVEPVEQSLNVKLTSQPQRLGPGENVTFEVQVTDSAGKPVQGEFSLAVVDLAALALADPNTADIVSAFYGNQWLGVQTSSDLSVYAQGMPPLKAAGMGGGGGGDAFTTVAREHFPDTAYWNAEIVTDQNGKAQVSLPLPDTLTTWQVEARGVTEDTDVGQASAQVVTSKDLLVRPVTPRFLVVGDHVRLAAIVQNNTAADLPVEAALQAEGFALDQGGVAQQVTIPANGRAVVYWWGVAQDVNEVDLTFFARGTDGQHQDAARPVWGALPVLRYLAQQSFRTAGTLDQADEKLELVSLPRSFDASKGSNGSLEVELSPSLAAGMTGALDVLEFYPYACTEQSLSRFLPNLEFYRALQHMEIESQETKARLERTLNEGMALLLSRQNIDGGWGWWANEPSDPYMTAYVLFGLARVKAAGVNVNENALQQAISFLQSGLPDPQMLKETWQLDRLAFEHFALTEAGAGNLNMTQALYPRQDELNPWAKALLALSLERLSPGSEQARTLFSDLQASAIRSATGAHWESDAPQWANMVDTITNSAMVVYALAQYDPASPVLADAARYLMSSRRPDGDKFAWASTYSTAWSVMGLTEVMKATGELGADFIYETRLNGLPLASGQAGPSQLNPVNSSVPIESLYPADPNALEIGRGPGAGRLYYTAGLHLSMPAETVAPLARGLSIERTYHPFGQACQEGLCEPIQAALSGQKVTVRLTLTLPNDAYNLVVEDMIPAGAEILDTRLKTSQFGESVEPTAEGIPDQQYKTGDPLASGWGWWYFNEPDIFDDHITWSADYLEAGTYVLTYTLVISQPGEYRVLPARAWQFYFPEVQGNSAGSLFQILP